MDKVIIQTMIGEYETINIPDTWKNAAWYEGKEITVDWIIEQIEHSLGYMEEVCGINLDETQEDFQKGIIAFRKEQAKYQKIRDDKWKDPEYYQKCHDMICNDGVNEMSKIIEACGRATAKELNTNVLEMLTNKG